jgi:hypothetical protein
MTMMTMTALRRRGGILTDLPLHPFRVVCCLSGVHVAPSSLDAAAGAIGQDPGARRMREDHTRRAPQGEEGEEEEEEEEDDRAHDDDDAHDHNDEDDAVVGAIGQDPGAGRMREDHTRRTPQSEEDDDGNGDSDDDDDEEEEEEEDDDDGGNGDGGDDDDNDTNGDSDNVRC